MSKSPDAFRTISEVADWLGVQAHVLRFWESKFSQVKPVKRAGGRRYYRPVDMLLLGGIRKLLHDDGLTIKGVQKILREQGMAYVSDLSLPLDDDTMEAIDAASAQIPPAPFAAPPPPEPEPMAGEVVDFPPVTPPEPPVAQPEVADEAKTTTPDTPADAPDADFASEPPAAAPPPITPDEVVDLQETAQNPDSDLTAEPEDAPTHEAVAEDTGERAQANQAVEAAEPDIVAAPAETDPAPEDTPADQNPDQNAVPAFLSSSKMTADEDTTDQAAPTAPPAPKPRVVDAPDPPAEDQIDVSASLLATLARVKRIAPEQQKSLRPLLAQLAALRDRMAAGNTPRSKE
jgi:DNA-binding transcriptional MerR regulator